MTVTAVDSSVILSDEQPSDDQSSDEILIEDAQRKYFVTRHPSLDCSSLNWFVTPLGTLHET